ncbi:MAG: phytoene/squalene synthase family protein [Halobacteria archaeon]
MEKPDYHEECKIIQKNTGSSYYFATKLLPKRVRRPTYILYAFFRRADEVVDSPNGYRVEIQRELLDEMESMVFSRNKLSDPVFEGFRKLRIHHDLSNKDIEEFFSSMRKDTVKKRYYTKKELKNYMRGSAVSVGRMMTDIMIEDPEDKTYDAADGLSEAFQLTNFIRDVREDLNELDRIYIPEEILESHGEKHQTLKNKKMNTGVVKAVRDILGWSEQRYKAGVEGIKYLPEDCRFPVLLAAVFYRSIHSKVRKNEFDIINNKPQVTKWERVKLTADTYLRWKKYRDPRETFQKTCCNEYSKQGIPGRGPRSSPDAVD